MMAKILIVCLMAVVVPSDGLPSADTVADADANPWSLTKPSAVIFAEILRGVLLSYTDMSNDMHRTMPYLCAMNKATNKIDDVMKALTGAVDCVNAVVNPTNITREITEANQQGRLNEVIKK